jgi:hypothetical protein
MERKHFTLKRKFANERKKKMKLNWKKIIVV